MPDDQLAARAAEDASSLRSGQDWAAWLRRAHLTQATGVPENLHGQPQTAALAALVHLARRHGFAVERGGCGDGTGFTSWPSRRIRMRADITPGQAVTALAHQLGHVLLHGQIAHLDTGGTISCGGLRRLEADSVAYLTAAHLGIDTTGVVFPYVSSWAGTDSRAHPAATIQAVTSRVVAAATAITAHLDAELIPGRTLGKPVGAAMPGPQRGRPSSAPAMPPVAAENIVQVNMAAQAYFQDRMPGSWVPGYLAARGFGDGIQRRWQAGHAPASWDALTRHLRALGFPDLVLEAAGLARRSRRGTLIDTFRNRAMLPIRSGDGTVIAFIGRAPDGAAPGTPKYLNSPRTSLYNKSKVLFGLWEAREALASGARPVIVEGPFDAIAVTTAGHGCFGGVAPCGTALTAQHADALSHTAEIPAADVLVVFDPDPAGRRAAVRAYHLLSQVTAEAGAVLLPPGQDPAQILAANGPEALAVILARCIRPLADLVIDADVEQWTRWLGHAEGQISALRAVAPVVAAMPPGQVARQVARLSKRLFLDHATVTDAVTDALRGVIARTERPRAGVPARDNAISGEQAPVQRGPPSRPASQPKRAGQDFPASVATAVKPANRTTPPRRQPTHGTQGPSRPGCVPG